MSHKKAIEVKETVKVRVAMILGSRQVCDGCKKLRNLYHIKICTKAHKLSLGLCITCLDGLASNIWVTVSGIDYSADLERFIEERKEQ